MITPGGKWRIVDPCAYNLFMRRIAIALAVLAIACGRDEESATVEQRAIPPQPPPAATRDAPLAEATPVAPAPSVPRDLPTTFPDLGAPATSFRAELRIKQWAKDGGEIQTERAPEGQSFLVITFPETAIGKSVSYVSSEYKLVSGGSQFAPHAVTIGGGYESLGPDVFQKEAFMTSRTCNAGSPFAVAFLVPRDLKNASIAVKDVAVGLSL